ncbi:AAA family ATPase [Roseibaca sp. Y0-43]|uniref:AAA family ATPase n=1 Tax=Roseibaca sp. Y0-43 TaxID=2816854 RepID=UPI001D0C0685|nr:AAA family ATPase [Roseibaca sp. Y0-43]MCC1482895.1 AAA family ATPase [Roseibaca sp. Y0-43]
MKHSHESFDADENGSEPSLLLPGVRVEIFSEYPQTVQVLRRVQRNRSFSRMTWRFRSGGLGAAIEEFKNRASPDLLIIESDEDNENLLPAIERLSLECGSNTEAFVIGAGAANEVELLRSLLKKGVSDYLPAPISYDQVVTSITDLFKDRSDLKLGKTTAFIGAGGGTGSSTIAQNVAVAMSRVTDKNVLLADLDPQFGTVGLSFGADDAYSITDALRRGGSIDDVFIQRITQQIEPKLGLLTVSPTIDNMPTTPSRAMRGILDTANNLPVHLILDMTHVWTPRTKHTICRADNVVITTMPTLAGLRNARDILRVLRRIRPMDPLPILVLNKTKLPKRCEVTEADFRKALELDHIFSIPYDARLFSKAQARGESVVHMDEGARVSERIIKLSRMLNGERNAPDVRSLSQRLAARLRKWW